MLFYCFVKNKIIDFVIQLMRCGEENQKQGGGIKSKVAQLYTPLEKSFPCTFCFSFVGLKPNLLEKLIW